jgi:hypothetical protein
LKLSDECCAGDGGGRGSNEIAPGQLRTAHVEVTVLSRQ